MNVTSTTNKYDRSKTSKSYGYVNNKDVKFEYITGLYIDRFRSLSKRTLKLGEYLTVITGKNGTMKSSILGLIAHPFSAPNNAKDMYGNELKTSWVDVFRLSLEKDTELYLYYIQGTTIKNEEISEPVRIYRRQSEKRHRLTVGATNEKGQGNFSLNTSYLNLKRLFPIIDTNAQKTDIEITLEDKAWIAKSYERIMQRSTYENSEAISDGKSKNTLAPLNSYYDFNSISSGEDNLGIILCKMLAFEKDSTNTDCLQGLLCIDEVEASLHPSAQIQLIDFFLDWSKRTHVQIVVTTHSLYLIDHCLRLQLKDTSFLEKIVINNLSTQQVGDDHNFNIMINPGFNTIYKELTYNDSSTPSPYKINIICEDDVAVQALRIILKPTVCHNLEFITNISGAEGTPWKGLVSLSKNGKKLLEDSIIVVDPDVNLSSQSNIDSNYIIKIPEPDNKLFPLERRIVYYIYYLDGANQLFNDREKDAIKSDLTRFHIFSSNLSDTNSLSISPFKNWKDENKRLYTKALRQYIKENPQIFLSFRTELLELINSRRAKKALPPLN